MDESEMITRTCEYEGCEQSCYWQQPYCRAHYDQKRRLGYLRPIGTPRGRTGPIPMSDDDALRDVEEFDLLIKTGMDLKRALHEIGFCARTMERRYQRLGRRAPAGLASKYLVR